MINTIASTKTKPLVLDIKGNALDDGPGIRSVVFLKGCLLNCDWCHNPESIAKEGEISFEANDCLGFDNCGPDTEVLCQIACPEQAININNLQLIERDKCTLCYHCVEACPTSAITRVGDSLSVDQICEQVLKYKEFYTSSGGGVTLSGGEPTLHMEFVSELLQKLKANGIHTLIQTCGLFPFEKFKKLIYPWLDMIYYDIKLYDEDQHHQYCGASNEAILSNFSKLQQLFLDGGVEILARTPLIPGITDCESNLKAIASFLHENKVSQIQLMNYNPIWHGKRDKLGYHSDIDEDDALKQWMTPTQVKRCETIFTDTGLQLV